MYPITISSRKEFTKRQQKKLKKMGLEWDGLHFCGYIPAQRQVNKIKYYCQQHHLNFKITNSLGNRSSDYRRIFFIYHKPQVMDKYYICAYCGKLMIKDKLTVDHLYPIGKSSKSVKYQAKLERRGIKNINDPKNLVAACKRCNSAKSAKTGMWILRGRLGRYKAYWILRRTVEMILVAVIVYYLFFVLHIQNDFSEIWKYIEKLLFSFL